MTTAQSSRNTIRLKWIVTGTRWLSILLILASLLLIIRALPLGQVMEAMKGWIGGLGIWGPVVLALVYVVATVLFVPGTILTLAAGALFGLVVGMITLAAVALVMVAAAAYAHFSAATIERWLGGRFRPPRVEMQEAYAENASGPAFNHSAFGSLLHQHLDTELNTNSLDSQKWSMT